MREMKTEKGKEFNLLHKHIITESGIYIWHVFFLAYFFDLGQKKNHLK